MNDERPTETVLFQNHMATNDEALLIDGEEFAADNKRFEAQSSWMMDNKGNGYLLPSGQIYVQQGLQHSRDESSEKPTKGHFALAVIEHGKAPKGAGYHYCVLPSTTVEKLKEKAGQESYSVLSQSAEKHIVYNTLTNETAYVFYEAANDNAEGLIKNTSLPCMAMSKQEGNSLFLSVVNPDLALYEGEADEIYKDGKRVERSIYSRPWRPSPSKETKLEIEVEGMWQANTEGITATQLDNGNTLLGITCQHGLTQDITLVKVQ